LKEVKCNLDLCQVGEARYRVETVVTETSTVERDVPETWKRIWRKGGEESRQVSDVEDFDRLKGRKFVEEATEILAYSFRPPNSWDTKLVHEGTEV